MNHGDDFEERLRALRPAALPPELMRRLSAADPSDLGRRPISYFFFAAPLGAAAAVLLAAAVISGITAPRPPAAAAPSLASASPAPSDLRVYLPAARRSTLVRVRDGGIMGADPEWRVRLVHATWVDDTAYIGDDHSVLHRQSRRTEIIPVALRSF